MCNGVFVSNHLKPRYYRYCGGWTNVCICRECKSIGLYEDMHPVNPCPFCGGIVKDYYSTGGHFFEHIKYVGRWIKPQYERKFFSKKLVKSGYWQLKEKYKILEK